MPAQPEPIVPVAAAVAAPEAPAPTEQPTAIDNFLASDEALPIAGAAGLGLLALAGAGLVVGRRRRRREDAEFAAQQEYAESLAEPGEITEPQRATMEPTFVRAFDAPVAAPAVAVAAPAAAEPTGPATALPEGFDLSRFGPHVQAAYKGPTADNPSASLKTRLRRAAALDQMARRSEAEPARPAETPAAKPAVGRQERADFMLARDGKKPSERPAYSTTLRPAHTH